MSELFPPSLTDMIACAPREVSMRRRVYPNWVKAGRMTQAKADQEISTMQAIHDRLVADFKGGRT